MKKVLTIIFAALLVLGHVNAEEKVKVYMFEAGGCPYCEAEEEYLKGLEGYGKTFELIKKELYVDHVEWKQGKDYKLGKAVAEAFNEAGFEDASYEGTPFVVISDLYAAASYSTDLEEIINLAYEEGDNDAVTCIKNNGTDCIRPNTITPTPQKESKILNYKAGVVVAVLGAILLVGVAVYVITNRKEEPLEILDTDDDKEVVEEIIEEEVLEEKPKRVVKRTTTKRTKNK